MRKLAIILAVLFILATLAVLGADKKISDLVTLPSANFAPGDSIPIVDVSANETKKTTVSELDLRYVLSTNVIDVAHGGTGVTSFTQGQVPFMGASTLLGDSYLTWNSTSKNLTVGNPGTESDHININGISYDSTFKVSDIDGTNYAQTILHRHSVTLEPLILGARSNSNTSAHGNVTASQNVFTIYGAGWLTSNYKIFGAMNIGASSLGTLSDTSAPGRVLFSTTENGAVWPTDHLLLDSDKSSKFEGPVVVNGSTLMPVPTGAALAIEGTTGALLLPRLTTAERNALTPSNGMMIYNTTVGGFECYSAAAWGACGGGGSNAYIIGSLASPRLIATTGLTAALGHMSTTERDQIIFVATSGGGVTVTANPQIEAGTIVGQRIMIVGTSDTNFVTLSNGNGLSLNGSWDSTQNATLGLFWNGSVWSETFRR